MITAQSIRQVAGFAAIQGEILQGFGVQDDDAGVARVQRRCGAQQDYGGYKRGSFHGSPVVVEGRRA